MSREIKFRAWLTNREGVTYSNGNHMEYDITVQNGKYADVESGWDIHGLYDYPIMQYTGLKDKNGVEIYEGDIVDCERHGFTTSIEYYGGAFRCRSEGVPLSLYIDECYADKDDNNQLEVIGNIYENPGLLEAEL